jgi:hypothetical protein
MSMEDAVGGALAVDPGVGAGDSGGDSGGSYSGGDDGGSGGEADPVVGGEESTGGADAQEFEIDEATGEQKLDADGNPIPKAAPTDTKTNFKSVYDKLKAADPKAADVFRKQHFDYQKYQQAFPTSADAVAAKELFDTYGGAEGIEEISGRAQQFASEMESFSKADPKFYAQLAKDDPEGFGGGAIPYLAELSNMPEAYNAALAPIFVNTLETSGITAGVMEAGNVLYEVLQSFKQSGNTQGVAELTQAFKALQKVYGATENLKQIAEKGAERPLSDREKALQQKEQQITKKERDAFYTEMQTKVVTAMDGLVDKSLSTYYKQFPKITKEQKADLHEGVFSFITRQLESNKKYQTQLRTLVNEGNQQKIANFVQQNVSKIVQESAKKIWNRRGFGNIPNSTKPAPGATNTGTVNLTAKPKYDDIFWEKDGGPTTEMMYMAGEAVLKGSKRRVKWDWSKQN